MGEASRLEALDQAYDEALERINGQKKSLRKLSKKVWHGSFMPRDL
jgi:hypothetical protein